MKEHSEVLVEKMQEYAKEDLVLAFSGGVDSGLLLYLACEAAKRTGHNVYAVTIQTTLHPAGEADAAAAMAKEAGAIHKIIKVDELQNAGVINNPEDRCYRCKKYIFSQLKELANEMGIAVILDGTNEDDLHVYRPGIRALRELNIESPLAECKMTKQEVRKMAEKYGLSVATKPSMPCLATRFPYNTELSYVDMKKVETAEEYIRSLGFYNVRVRVHGDIARIEVDEEDLDKILSYRIQILKYLKEIGYIYVTVDLNGFHSGSMDYKVEK